MILDLRIRISTVNGSDLAIEEEKICLGQAALSISSRSSL
jgi:hypothetical protein